MRIIRIIILIAVITLAAGCGRALRTRTVPVESAPQEIADEASPAEAVPETAPFGNAALAGKPEDADEAAARLWDFQDATTWLLGDINPVLFNNPPHSEWYMRGYNDYQPEQEFMARLKNKDIDDLTITIVLGTWCSDSRIEVPRFMKIIDLWGFPREKIRFIGVDINKIAPLEEYSGLDIERVPTFIFFEKKIEKGRIIEVPVTSLEQDTENILAGTK